MSVARSRPAWLPDVSTTTSRSASLRYEIETALDDIDGDQIIKWRVDESLQDELPHKTASDESNAVAGLDLAMIEASHSARDGFDDPVFVRQVGFRNLVGAFG